MYRAALIYFDHNATSPLCTAAREAWVRASEDFPANPASPHRLGGRAEAALEQARVQVAEWLQCSPLDLVWTSGATEANNSLLYHASLDAAGEVWVSAIEHPSVLEAARRWLGARLRLIPATPQGLADMDWLADRLKRTRPALAVLMAANNETGVLQPWRDALALCREREVPFACDAAQWAGKLDARGLGECDFVTGCAHKFGGGPGTGFLKVPARFHPLLAGGAQEHGRRAGTQNVAGVLAMTAAWALRQEQIARGETDPREQARDRFIARLQDALPDFEILGAGTPRLWNTAAALMPSTDCRKRWVVRLDKAGFAVSTGSACASGKARASHVLLAMGYPPEHGDRMLRFSAGWETSPADWDALGSAILRLASS